MELYEEALADFDKAIELQPDNATAYKGRGSLYEFLGEYGLADADYARAAELE
jgi:Flp pilus assembly protein TadD